MTTDTLIIGAGPAGTSCAIALQQAGKECLLCDKSAFPRTKLCGGLFTNKSQISLRQPTELFLSSLSKPVPDVSCSSCLKAIHS